MLKKQNKIVGLCFFLALILVVNNCQSRLGNQPNLAKVETSKPPPGSPSPNENVALKIVVDVPKLSGLTAADLEKVLGKPKEVKTVADKNKKRLAEYRLYHLPNHPQGLTIHFYNGRAVVFNLVLGEAEKSATAALAKHFMIDVKNVLPIEKTPFLEKWQGKFNNVRFVSVYAMKERLENTDYKLLHAEIVR